MSVVVGRLSKSGSNVAADLRSLWQRMPIQQEPSVRHFKNGEAELVFFDYGAAQEFEQLSGGASQFKVFGQGVLTAEARRWLPSILSNQTPKVNPAEHPENVCGVVLGHNELRIFTSSAGTDGFLVLETDDAWVFSNHHSPLSAFIGMHTGIRQDALAWSLLKYHNMEFQHYLDGITRTQPGSIWIARNGGVQAIPMQVDWSQLTQPIKNGEAPELVENVGASLSDYLLSVPREKSLSLSGGKDSRAILGMLGDDIYGRWVTFSTGGELYSPDVMAASSLTKLADLTNQHYISQPPLVSVPGDLTPQIANDLLTDCALTSLADIRPVSVRKSLVLGGHEYGTKGTSTYLTLDQLIERETRYIANSPFLQQGAKDRLAEHISNDVKQRLGEVPQSKTETLWKINYRLPLLQGTSITSRNVGATEVHPFLDFRFLRLVLGASPEFISSQAIHYFLNRRMSRPIENAPFANDVWPPSLFELLREYDVDWRGAPATPYRFNSAFPSQSGFGRYNWRIELFKAMRRSVVEYLNDGDYDRETFRADGMIQLVNREESEWSFENLYQLGSILKFCLVNELGTALLDASNRELVESKVRDFVGAEPVGETVLPRREAIMEDALQRSTTAIRDLAEQIHRTEGEVSLRADSRTILSLLGEGAVTTELIERIFPYLATAGGVKEVPEVGRLEIKGETVDGEITVRGFAFKDKSTTLLVGFEGFDQEEVDGATFSPAGFHYFYVIPDEQGYFERTIRVPVDEPTSIQLFAQRWYSQGPIYMAFTID